MAYSFQVNPNGAASAVYAEGAFNTFIVNEVRPRIGPAAPNFFIRIASGGQTLTLEMRGTDLYVVRIGTFQITVPTYGTTTLKITRGTFDAAFLDGLGGAPNEDTMRVIPFFFSEAARFSIVNLACWRIIRKGDSTVSVKWNDFKGLLNAWKTLCTWKVANGGIPGGSHQGAGNLFVPVETDVMTGFNAATVNKKLPIPSGFGI
ncbi:hypothetical protein [Falsiroseomonas sp. CW058]|uniref:hypothetical protein n=1 Tax=Falsiroseomonas sp. CW058 TaxID=3388664 RepID=UPI003D31B786